MAVFETSFESGVTWDTSIGSPTISTDRPRTGSNSLHINNSLEYIIHDCAQSDVSPWFVRCYVNFESFPAAGNPLILQWTDSEDGEEIGIHCNTSGELRASSNGGLIGSSSDPLQLDTWYRLDLVINAFGNGCEAYLEGVILGSVAQSQIGENSLRLKVGMLGDTSVDMYIDDIVVDQSPLPDPPVSPTAITFIGTADDTSGGSTLTFSNVDIGTASSDRLVVVGCSFESSNAVSNPREILSCTIDAVSATRVVHQINGAPTAIFSLPKDTETSADIEVVCDGDLTRGTIGIWTITGHDPGGAVDTASIQDADGGHTSLSVDVDIPQYGVAVGVIANGTPNPITWTGAEERYDTALGSNSQFSGADVQPIDSPRVSHSVSTSFSTSSQAGSLCAAVWQPFVSSTVNRFTGDDNDSLAWSTISPGEGDLVIVVFANDGGDDQTTPGELTRLDTNNGTSVEAGVYYRICDGEESGNLITNEGTFGVSGEEYCFHVFHIPSGEWHGTSPPEIQVAGGGGTTGTIDPPSLTASWGALDNIWFAVAVRDDDDGISSLGSDYIDNFTYTQSASSTGSCEIASSWRFTSLATENPPQATQTNTNEEWIAYTIVVRPAAAGEDLTASTDIDLDLTLAGTTVKAGETTSEFDLDASISGAADATKVASSDAIDLDLSVGATSVAQKEASTEFDLVLSVDEADGTPQKEAATDYDLILDLDGDATTGEKSASTSLSFDLVVDPDSETKSSASVTDIDLNLDLDVLSVKSGITATDLDILLDFDSDANLKTASASTSLDVALDIDNSSSVGIRDLFVVVNPAGVESFTHSVGVVDVPLPVDADSQSIDVSAGNQIPATVVGVQLNNISVASRDVVTTDGVNNITTSVGKDDSVEVDSAAIRPGVSGVGI